MSRTCSGRPTPSISIRSPGASRSRNGSISCSRRLLFLLGRALGRSDRRLDVAFAILFVLVIAALRAFARAAGLGPERAAGDALPHRIRSSGASCSIWRWSGGASSTRRRVQGSRALLALGAGLAAATALEFRRRDAGARGRRRRAAALPVRVGAVRPRRGRVLPGGGRTVQGAADRGAELLSRPHLVLGLPVPHRHRHGAEAASVGGWPLPAQLALYIAAICAFSSLFWRGFERPVPGGAAGLLTGGASSRARSGERRRSESAAGGGRLRAAALGLRLPRRRRSGAQRLHGERAPSVLSGAGRRGRRSRLRSPSAPGGSRAGLGVAARALLLFALALPGGRRALSVHDRRADRRLGRQPDLFLPGGAREPGRVRHVVVLLPQRMDPRRRHPRRHREARPAQEAPVRARAWNLGAACSTPPSGSMSAGFRGPEIAAEKGDRFRIVALGESQTFGPTLRDGEKPWPERLQDLFSSAACSRPIEVINAGNRGLYARGQPRTDAPRHPAARARSRPLDPRHERSLRAGPASGSRAERARRAPAGVAR